MSLFINFITAQDRLCSSWIVLRILCGILIDALVSPIDMKESTGGGSPLSRMVIIDPSAVSTVNAMEMYMDVVLEIE